MKLTTDRHEASRGLFATTELVLSVLSEFLHGQVLQQITVSLLFDIQFVRVLAAGTSGTCRSVV